jgi:hypothetical protein
MSLVINSSYTEDSKAELFCQIDNIILSPQLSLEVAKLLLNFFFHDYNDDLKTNKRVRRFLVTDFYVMLREKQNSYFDELNDFSKNADYHNLTQKRIKNICDLWIKLQKKEYHDEILYFMDIMS